MTALGPRCGKPMTIYDVAAAPAPEKYYQGTGAAIRQARIAHGLSQRRLADALGVNLSTLWRWENDQKWPRKAAVELERLLGISIGAPPCARPAGHNGPCRTREAQERAERARQLRRAA